MNDDTNRPMRIPSGTIEAVFGTTTVGKSTATIKKSKEQPKERKIYPINIYEGDCGYNLRTHQKHYVNLSSELNIGGFLGTFMGCCGYAIYYQVAYHSEEIKEVTEVFTKILRENEATGDGFGAIMATVTDLDHTMRYKKCGWKLINEHINPLTDNTIYTIILEP